MKVVLLPQASDDLDEILEPVLGRVLRRLRMLEKFPQLGAPMAGPFTGYRSSVIDMFRIVYRLRPRNVIEVAYVRHCRRAPPA
ncbi:MAG: type II toxin-antitoxin system RelE/ParE family toxin [Myxococcales bacterium]|nr:type II toxin-antitoxin system RelE/ParE family toxin [Myxococcales bacterium]